MLRSITVSLIYYTLELFPSLLKNDIAVTSVVRIVCSIGEKMGDEFCN